ncbi:MAG: hypothetical protein V3U92_14650 [Cellulophaga sp.]
MKHLTLLIVFTLLIISCNNDDGNTINETVCNYQGLSYLDTSNNNQTLLPETDLQTQFFPNSNNGPFGSPGVEISSFVSSPTLFFTTNVIDLNTFGPGTLTLDGIDYSVTVTCQRAGTAIGDEFRYDIVAAGIEAEFCVGIDEVL